MWARHCEVFLGLWLAVSWLLFSYPSKMSSFVYIDWIGCTLICVFSLSCYWDRMRHLHLLNFIVACIYIVFVLISENDTGLPLYQNYMVVGLLLLMFSIIPTNTSQPPHAWRKFLQEKIKLGDHL